MKNSHRWFAVAMAAVFVLAFAGDSFAAVAAPAAAKHAAAFDWQTAVAFTLAVGLEPLRAQLTTLKAEAEAKLAEVKPELSKEAQAALESAHKVILANVQKVTDAITAEERRVASESGAAKPWAAGFYMTAANSGLDLAALNTIVLNAATHEAAKDALIDAMAASKNADKPGATGARTSVGTEAREKFVEGVTASIVAKAGIFGAKEGGERNEFSSYTMRELARISLEHAGVRERISDPLMMVGRAMQPVIMGGAMSSSDFTNILANVANKSMLKGYGEADETFSLWTGKGTLTDFKITNRVDLGLFPNLDLVVEGGEYNYAKLTDRGVQVVLATYGKMFPITRQAIINDDLNAFTKVPLKMGRAAHRTVGNLVYAVLTANAAMADTVALFHASKGNLATGGASALSATSLDAARAAMAKQKDKDLIAAGLNIRPAFWIGPVALEGQAKQIFSSQSEPGQDNPQVGNRVANMATPIADARLDAASTTAWYLAANPNTTDTIEVDYLNGVETPTLEQRDGWNVDGVEFKVRHDAGVNLLDRVGLYKSAGQ